MVGRAALISSFRLSSVRSWSKAKRVFQLREIETIMILTLEITTTFTFFSAVPYLPQYQCNLLQKAMQLA